MPQYLSQNTMASSSALLLVLIKSRIPQLIGYIHNNNIPSEFILNKFDTFMIQLDMFAPRAFEGVSASVVESLHDDLYLASIFAAVDLRHKAVEIMDSVIKTIDQHLYGRWFMLNRLVKREKDASYDIGVLDSMPGPALNLIVSKLTTC